MTDVWSKVEQSFHKLATNGPDQIPMWRYVLWLSQSSYAKLFHPQVQGESLVLSSVDLPPHDRTAPLVAISYDPTTPSFTSRFCPYPGASASSRFEKDVRSDEFFRLVQRWLHNG